MGAGEAAAGVGVGGGGIDPLGGPYWRTGRASAGCFCCFCGCDFGAGAGDGDCFCAEDGGGSCGGSFDALTANMVASTICGSIVIVTVPTLVMLSFGGLLGS